MISSLVVTLFLVLPVGVGGMSIGSVGEPSASPAIPRDVTASLVQLGYENVRVSFEQNVCTITYEDRVNRYSVVGIGQVLDTVSPILPEDSDVVLVSLDCGLPSYEMRVPISAWRSFRAGEMSPQALARTMSATRSISEGAFDRGMPAANSSFGRSDIAVGPGFEYELANGLKKALVTDWSVNFRTDTTLARGLSVETKERLGLDNSPTRVEQVTLSYTMRPRNGDIFLHLAAGKFQDSLSGAFGQALWYSADDRWRLGASASWIDSPPWPKGSYLADLEWIAPSGELRFRLRAGRFLAGDKGVLTTVTRDYGETAVQVAAGKSQLENRMFAAVTMPFGPRHLPRPSSFRPRLRTSLTFTHVSTNHPGTDTLPDAIDVRRHEKGVNVPYLLSHVEELSPETTPAAESAERDEEEAYAPSLSLEGHTGLLRIPTAQVVPDGKVVLSGSAVQHPYQSSGELHYDSYATRASAVFGFAKNLEVDLRYSFYPAASDPRWPQWDFMTDRVVGFQYLIQTESDKRPAIAVGAHDFAWGSREAEAEYVVAGKRIGDARYDVGIGAHRLSGLFGGVSYDPARDIGTMLEWDSEHLNFGVQYRISDRLSAKAALLGMSSGAGCVNYTAEM